MATSDGELRALQGGVRFGVLEALWESLLVALLGAGAGLLCEASVPNAPGSNELGEDLVPRSLARRLAAPFRRRNGMQILHAQVSRDPRIVFLFVLCLKGKVETWSFRKSRTAGGACPLGPAALSCKAGGCFATRTVVGLL